LEKTVGAVAISKKFDDIHSDIGHHYRKLQWLQAAEKLKTGKNYYTIKSDDASRIGPT